MNNIPIIRYFEILAAEDKKNANDKNYYRLANNERIAHWTGISLSRINKIKYNECQPTTDEEHKLINYAGGRTRVVPMSELFSLAKKRPMPERSVHEAEPVQYGEQEIETPWQMRERIQASRARNRRTAPAPSNTD